MPEKVDVTVRAQRVRELAEKTGLKVSAHAQIVNVSGSFTPGDRDAYVRMENDALQILNLFRYVHPGSIWGSDSGSVGGAIALRDGKFSMNKSGVEKLMARKFY